MAKTESIENMEKNNDYKIVFSRGSEVISSGTIQGHWVAFNNLHLINFVIGTAYDRFLSSEQMRFMKASTEHFYKELPAFLKTNGKDWGELSEKEKSEWENYVMEVGRPINSV